MHGNTIKPGNQLVSVAMTTYNGGKFLKEQLDSIYAQTHQHIEVVVCDDCSSDDTLLILKEYQGNYGLQYSVNKHRVGIAQNFEKAISLCSGNYIALCDQDDVWLPSKIERSLALMSNMELIYANNTPLLVFSDLTIVDQQLCVQKTSLWKHLKINPANARFNRLLVENVITGCTVIMNKSLVTLAFPIPRQSLMHDVWLGLVASYFGHIAHLNEATVLYRQHARNAIGAYRLPIHQVLKKAVIKMMHSGSKFFEKEILQAEAFEIKFFPILDANAVHKQALRNFISCKHSNFFYRKYLIIKYGFFGNTLKRTLNILIRF